MRAMAFPKLGQLGVALGLVGSLWGCYPCPEGSSRGIWSEYAPDGAVLVDLRQINTPAGSSFKYKLVLYPQGGATTDSGVLWRSNGCGPTYVFWVTDRLLELHVPSETSNPKCAEELFEARHTRYRWKDYEVKIVPIRSLYKRDLLESGDR